MTTENGDYSLINEGFYFQESSPPKLKEKKKYGKICLSFKSPDVVHYAIGTAVEFVDDDDERDDIIDKIQSVCGKFIKFGEYLKIEIDLDNETAEVKRV